MRVIIVQDMPNPNDFERYTEACARAVIRFVHQTRGRAFVLFTSSRMLNKVAGLVRNEFTRSGYELFRQGGGLPRHILLERFKEAKAGVLFGLNSFWVGVDVRGEALSNVIITRLPFAVPDHPVIQARLKRLKDKGLDPFKEYSLPEAVLKFRQGVGRLIRTSTDQGIVVVLDARISNKWYGRFFLKSLPECPLELTTLD